MPTSSSTLCRTTIREFLLVPYFGACVHMPPPPANQLIHVIPDQPIAAGLNMSPVWVNGVLNVGRVESEMGSAGYQMRAMKVEAYTEPLPRCGVPELGRQCSHAPNDVVCAAASLSRPQTERNFLPRWLPPRPMSPNVSSASMPGSDTELLGMDT